MDQGKSIKYRQLFHYRIRDKIQDVVQSSKYLWLTIILNETRNIFKVKIN